MKERKVVFVLVMESWADGRPHKTGIQVYSTFKGANKALRQQLNAESDMTDMFECAENSSEQLSITKKNTANGFSVIITRDYKTESDDRSKDREDTSESGFEMRIEEREVHEEE
jgi:hypothetical protein